MADIDPLFKTLIDGSGLSFAVDKKSEGDVSTGNGGIGFAFKDASGNLVLPTLTADGKFSVTQEAPGVCYSKFGSLTGTATKAVVVSEALVLEKSYSKIGAVVACATYSLFELYAVDDAGGTPVDTLLGAVIVGPGQYTVKLELDCLMYSTVGGTGTQALEIRGQNLQANRLSDMRATVSALEAA